MVTLAGVLIDLIPFFREFFPVVPRGMLLGSPAILPFRIGRKLTVHGIKSLRKEDDCAIK